MNEDRRDEALTAEELMDLLGIDPKEDDISTDIGIAMSDGAWMKCPDGYWRFAWDDERDTDPCLPRP